MFRTISNDLFREGLMMSMNGWCVHIDYIGTRGAIIYVGQVKDGQSGGLGIQKWSHNPESRFQSDWQPE